MNKSDRAKLPTPAELIRATRLSDREIAARTGLDASTVYRIRTESTSPSFMTYALLHAVWEQTMRRAAHE